MLDSIRVEHGYITQLLDVLQQKLFALRNGHNINYRLVKDIVDYLQDQAEKCHHPKEDVIYQYYQSHYAKGDEVLNLLEEHRELEVITQEFADTVDMILMDAVIPMDLFADKLNNFVMRQRSHLRMEETKVLPLIKDSFTERDWELISNSYQEQQDDPLFGEKVAARYQRLANRLAERVY